MMKVHHISWAAKKRIMHQLRRLLAQREEIVFACVHGSFVESGIGFRDIDVGVWVESPLVSLRDALDQQWDWNAILERHVTYPVDVRVLNGASLGFRHAASGGLLLFAKDREVWYKFREETWLHYLDFSPISKQMLFDLLSVSP